MAWGKIDDKLYSAPKWLAATQSCRALWITALSWCMAQLTDGFVPMSVLPMLGGRKRDADGLVSVGLWREVEGGWQFHDWLDYQPSREQVMAERAAAAERQRRAREKAKEKRDGETVTDMSRRDSRVNNGVGHGPPDPTRPDPINKHSPSEGKSPKQRASDECPHGRKVGAACGACADARRKAKDEADAQQRELDRRNRAAQEAERRQRKAEADATEPDDGTGAAKALQALKAAKEGQ